MTAALWSLGLSAYKVKTGTKMAEFLSSVGRSIAKETGRPAPRAVIGPLQALIQRAVRVPPGRVATDLAPMFGEARQLALAASAPQTAKGIRDAASWFYYNVEGGAPSGGGEVVQLPGQPPRRRRPGKRGKGGKGKGTPFYRKWWFVPSVIGGVGLILTVSILASGSPKRRDDR
jgi:hypothetical protein